MAVAKLKVGMLHWRDLIHIGPNKAGLGEVWLHRYFICYRLHA